MEDIVMAINQGETLARILLNYHSYRFAAWSTANWGISDHEAMENLDMSTSKGTSDYNIDEVS